MLTLAWPEAGLCEPVELQLQDYKHNTQPASGGPVRVGKIWALYGVLQSRLGATGSCRMPMVNHELSCVLMCPLWHTVHHLAQQPGQYKTGWDPSLRLLAGKRAEHLLCCLALCFTALTQPKS